MANCPACNSEVDDLNPAIVGERISDFQDWDSFESDNDRYGFPEGKTFNVLNLGDVKVIKKQTGYPGLKDSYDELPQGTEFDTFLIFGVGGRFYKKEGTGNSYGTVTWDGPFREVKPQEKTVVVYEFN